MRRKEIDDMNENAFVIYRDFGIIIHRDNNTPLLRIKTLTQLGLKGVNLLKCFKSK